MQVGKKYKCCETIYECIKILDNGNAVVIWNFTWGNNNIPSDGAGVVLKDQFHMYPEYKEPRKGTFWVNVYSDGIGAAFKSEQKAKTAAMKSPYLMACVEVPWVEGQGIKCNCTAAGGQPCGKKGCDQ